MNKLLDNLQDYFYDRFDFGTKKIHKILYRNDGMVEISYSLIYRRLSDHIKDAIWCYRNAWEYSFFGMLNLKWYKHYFYKHFNGNN